jgi:predicted  nucleic acid-binding Zn-ribbon protein
MSVVSELFTLQELDLALDRALARLEEVEAGLVETEELIQARQEKEEKEQAVDLLRARQKELEWEVEEVRTKAAEVEAKLYGGTVRNPKELSDLDADLRAIKTQVARREDALLGLMVEIDEAEGESRRAGESFAETNRQFQSRAVELTAEKSTLEPEAEDLRSRRDEKAAGIDQSALRLYRLLRERKGGVGIARVEQGMCQGCRISLPGAVLTRARMGTGIVQCVSCERIIYIG